MSQRSQGVFPTVTATGVGAASAEEIPEGSFVRMQIANDEGLMTNDQGPMDRVRLAQPEITLADKK